MHCALHLRMCGVRGSRTCLFCTAAIGLSCRNGLGMLPGSNVQRGLPLNLESLYCDIRDLKSRVLCDPKRIKLRGIESLRYSFERPGQGSADRRFFR